MLGHASRTQRQASRLHGGNTQAGPLHAGMSDALMVGPQSQLWLAQEEGLQRFASYLCQRVSVFAAQEYSRLVEAPGEFSKMLA